MLTVYALDENKSGWVYPIYGTEPVSINIKDVLSFPPDERKWIVLALESHRVGIALEGHSIVEYWLEAKTTAALS